MNRTLKTERLFPLGDFKNIKFADEMIDIPEKVCMDENLMSKLRYLQMIDVELAYRQYLDLIKKVGTIPLEEAMKILLNEHTTTLQEIEKIIKY
jgi:hypothetical protein